MALSGRLQLVNHIIIITIIVVIVIVINYQDSVNACHFHYLCHNIIVTIIRATISILFVPLNYHYLCHNIIRTMSLRATIRQSAHPALAQGALKLSGEI